MLKCRLNGFINISNSTKNMEPKDKAFFFAFNNLRKGRDNKYWVVNVDSNGNKVWARHPFDKYKDGYSNYLTHNNGRRPFRVYVSDDRTVIHVYKVPKNGIDLDINDNEDEYDQYSHTQLVATYSNLKKVFIPEGEDAWNPATKYPGNSILVQLQNDHYIYIGNIVYSFSAPESITHYYSLVGNSDVPYPVAVGTVNAYFMLDQVYVPKVEFSGTNWSDVYGEFYGHSFRAGGQRGPPENKTKFPNYMFI